MNCASDFAFDKSMAVSLPIQLVKGEGCFLPCWLSTRQPRKTRKKRCSLSISCWLIVTWMRSNEWDWETEKPRELSRAVMDWRPGADVTSLTVGNVSCCPSDTNHLLMCFSDGKMDEPRCSCGSLLSCSFNCFGKVRAFLVLF